MLKSIKTGSSIAPEISRENEKRNGRKKVFGDRSPEQRSGIKKSKLFHWQKSFLRVYLKLKNSIFKIQGKGISALKPETGYLMNRSKSCVKLPVPLVNLILQLEYML